MTSYILDMNSSPSLEHPVLRNSRALRPIVIARPKIVIQEEPDSIINWTYELKHVGIQSYLHYDSGVCVFLGNQEMFLPALQMAIANFLRNRRNLRAPIENVSFDGQIVKIAGGISYQFFDVIWLNSEDLREQKLSYRRSLLESHIGTPSNGPLTGTASTPWDGRRIFQASIRNGLPGMMAKCLDHPYSPDVEWKKVPNPNWKKQSSGTLIRR